MIKPLGEPSSPPSKTPGPEPKPLKSLVLPGHPPHRAVPVPVPVCHAGSVVAAGITPLVNRSKSCILCGIGQL
jgi:hypothetical protein